MVSVLSSPSVPPRPLFNSTVPLHETALDPADAVCVFINSRSYVRNSVRMPALSSKAGVHAMRSASCYVCAGFYFVFQLCAHKSGVKQYCPESVWFAPNLSSGLTSFSKWHHWVCVTTNIDSATVYSMSPLIVCSLPSEIFPHAAYNKTVFTKFTRKFPVSTLTPSDGAFAISPQFVI